MGHSDLADKAYLIMLIGTVVCVLGIFLFLKWFDAPTKGKPSKKVLPPTTHDDRKRKRKRKPHR